ncbi:MAG: hypothetical protein GDA35_07985 [Hyphomonadaceae bacterium]|nr:hypothetical protein [Hyphomonadaceae bacterium]
MSSMSTLPDNQTCVVYAASIGHSVWFSRNLGENWQRANTNSGGIYNESRAWCLSVHPDRPGEVIVGTDDGVYRWVEIDKRWNYVPSPMDGLHILKIAQADHDPDFIIAGTRPAGLFRSKNNGRSWDMLDLPGSVEAPFINTHRVTSIKFDPKHEDMIWVTIEIDGLWRSGDGGDTWDHIGLDLPDEDTHNVEIVDFDSGDRSVLIATEAGLYRSKNNGRSFHHIPVPESVCPYHYYRCLRRRADKSGVMFLTVGDRPSGEDSIMLRSRDFGESWERVDLPGNQVTTIWDMGVNAADPMIIFAISIFGEVYRSPDGGEVWEKMDNHLGEAREIIWAPVPTAMLGEQQKAWGTVEEFLGPD